MKNINPKYKNCQEKVKIHFVGIGGIGVSALARYYLEKGYQVSGSDLASSEITEALKKLGAKIFIGPHNPKCLTPEVNQVIYSPAVLPDNQELREARKRKIKVQSYPEALGELTKKYFTIAVCGSHGKSTVAAMIGLILTKAGLNPTVILGTKLREFGDSNFRMGGNPNTKYQILDTRYLIIEADEHFASFLNYWPKIIVLTTLELDHLDFYKNFKNYILAFKKFISHLPKNGILVANKDEKNIYTTFFATAKNVEHYSLKEKESKKLRKILKIPGEFNVSNALAALTVARTLSVPDKISFKSLSEYKGSWRRFEIKRCYIPNTKYQILVINDYGHHPTQIRVTLAAAREKFPKRKIWCVFQPHQYQRTYYLFNDFVKVFREACDNSHGPIRISRGQRPRVGLFACDKLIITDIYSVAGRESAEIKKKVSAKKLVEAIKKDSVIYLKKEKVLDYLKRNLRGGEVVIIMGSGDIYNLGLKLK